MRAVDTKVYWNWSRKDNNSTQMTFTPVAGSSLQCGGGPCTTELFNYKKYNLGADVGYRFNPENRVVAGFDYLDADRERIDFIHNIDRKYSLEWKNSAFETLDTKAKYQYLTRSSNFVQTGNFDQFQRRFDLQNVNQNLAKLAFDWTPRQYLDYGLEILYKDNDYTGDRQFLQRTKDKREEIYGSIGFGDPKSFRMWSRRRRSIRSSTICSWVVTSRPVVGSSSTTRSGSQASAMAMQTRCCCPPES